MTAQPHSSCSMSALQRHGLSALALLNFRHTRNCHISSHGRSVLLSGENGAGKTNLLEAISLLSPGRGVRQASAEQFLNRDASKKLGWQIKANLHGSDYTLRTAWQENQAHRQVFIEDERISQQRLGDYCRTLALGPRDDQLFLQGNVAIRHFMDRLISEFDPEHVGRVQNLRKLQKQWRDLIEAEVTPDPQWFRAVEKQLASRMVVVSAARLRHAKALMEMLAQHPDLIARIMGGAGQASHYWQIELKGEIAYQLATQPAVTLEEALSAKLEKARHPSTLSELADQWQFTLAGGKHRVAINDLSHGQQKIALLSFIIGQAWLMREQLGQVPIILLDEATNQLDDHHCHILFDHLHELESQYWMSGVDLSRWRDRCDKAMYWNLSTTTGETHVVI